MTFCFTWAYALKANFYNCIFLSAEFSLATDLASAKLRLKGYLLVRKSCVGQTGTGGTKMEVPRV